MSRPTSDTSLPDCIDGFSHMLTAQVQARRDKQRPTKQPARRGAMCPSCFTEMPASRSTCVFCG